MRKVIKGKLYDTEKAREVGYWSNGWTGRDYRNATLYCKRTGEYFAHRVAGEYDPVDTIEPLAYDDARAWAEAHLDADEYESEFGIPDEGEEHDLHTVVSEAAWQAISRTAAVEGTTVRAIIERLAETL